MKRMFTLFALTIAMTSTAAYASFGAKSIMLGSTSLTDRTDRDFLVLPRCAGSRNKPVSHVKLAIKQYPAQIDYLKVVFQNGQKQQLAVKLHYRAGESTRWIDLIGPKRCLRKIVIVGDTDTFYNRPLAQAKVVVYGLK